MSLTPLLRRTAFYLAIAASTAVMAACAVGITRLYTGQRSPDEVSVIIWDPSATVRFEKVDGTALSQNVMRVQRVEFLPGTHIFTIRVPGESQGTQLVTMTRETSAGRCYTLQNKVMAVSVEVNGRVATPSATVPILADTAVAACPLR